jgi:hypothetical protein
LSGNLHLPSAEPFEHWFYIHEWAPLIIFFGTYLGIVRNKKIPHVARYHIMMVRFFCLSVPAWMLPSICVCGRGCAQREGPPQAYYIHTPRSLHHHHTPP